jgi:D-amino peptidase
MKVYITTDMEGVGGITSWEQVKRESGTPFEEGRALLTGEVNAAVEGALAGGADEIVVVDGHAAGHNFILEKLHPAARYVSAPGSAIVAQALDSTFAAVALLGYHAMAGTPRAIMDHTQHSKTWLNYYLNGKRVGEIAQGAALAGHYGVPVVFVSGDKAACDEAIGLLEGVETVAVKEGYARECALMLAPVKARELIAEGMERALKRRHFCKPFVLETPIEVRIEFQDTAEADRYQRLGWERLDGRTARKTAANALEIIDP